MEALENVTILSHAVNMGKGAALKTGINYVSKHFSEALGVITVDADGQHKVQDILKVQNAFQQNPNEIILGVRTFGESVPWRSKFGNTLSQYLFRKIYKKKINDTQTGLRAIPTKIFPEMLALTGSRY